MRIFELEYADVLSVSIEKRSAAFASHTLQEWASVVIRDDHLRKLISITPEDQVPALFEALNATVPSRFSLIANEAVLRNLLDLCPQNLLLNLVNIFTGVQKHLLSGIICSDHPILPVVCTCYKYSGIVETKLLCAIIDAKILLTDFMRSIEDFRTILRNLSGVRHSSPAAFNYLRENLQDPRALQKLHNLNFNNSNLAQLFHFFEGAQPEITTILNNLPPPLLPLVYVIPRTKGSFAYYAYPRYARKVEEYYSYIDTRLKITVFQAIRDSGKLADLIGKDPAKLADLMEGMAESTEILTLLITTVSSSPEFHSLAIPVLMGDIRESTKRQLFNKMNLQGWGKFIRSPEELDYALGLANDIKNPEDRQNRINNIVKNVRISEHCLPLVLDAEDKKMKFKHLTPENYSRLVVVAYHDAEETKSKISSYAEELLKQFPKAENEIKTAFGDPGTRIEIILNSLSLALCVSLLRIMQASDEGKKLVWHLCKISDFWFDPKLKFPRQSFEVHRFTELYQSQRNNSSMFHFGRSNFVAEFEALNKSHQFWAIVRRSMEKERSRSLDVINEMIKEKLQYPEETEKTLQMPSAPIAASAPEAEPFADHELNDGPPGGPNPHSDCASVRLFRTDNLSQGKAYLLRGRVRYLGYTRRK